MSSAPSPKPRRNRRETRQKEKGALHCTGRLPECAETRTETPQSPSRWQTKGGRAGGWWPAVRRRRRLLLHRSHLRPERPYQHCSRQHHRHSSEDGSVEVVLKSHNLPNSPLLPLALAPSQRETHRIAPAVVSTGGATAPRVATSTVGALASVGRSIIAVLAIAILIVAVA